MCFVTPHNSKINQMINFFQKTIFAWRGWHIAFPHAVSVCPIWSVLFPGIWHVFVQSKNECAWVGRYKMINEIITQCSNSAFYSVQFFIIMTSNLVNHELVMPIFLLTLWHLTLLLPSMETRRIQDMLLTINNSIRSTRYNLRHDYILSLPKVNTTKYGLKSWRYFAAKKWNELANDIRIKAGTNAVKNKIRLPKFYWNRDS